MTISNVQVDNIRRNCNSVLHKFYKSKVSNKPLTGNAIKTADGASSRSANVLDISSSVKRRFGNVVDRVTFLPTLYKSEKNVTQQASF